MKSSCPEKLSNGALYMWIKIYRTILKDAKTSGEDTSIVKERLNQMLAERNNRISERSWHVREEK